MTRVERSGDVRATINHLAAGSFKNHVLTWEADKLSWLCRAPESGNHAFRVYFAPGTVFVWGDIGEYVFIHSDRNSLGWFLGQGGKEGDYPDYFLGKLRAVGGEKGAREFYVGDALDNLAERLSEDVECIGIAEIHTAPCGWVGPVSAVGATGPMCPECAGQVSGGKLRDLADEFKLYADDPDEDAQTVWHRLHRDILDDGEPPECEGPTSSALWVWHAARTFARLHAATYGERATEIMATTTLAMTEPEKLVDSMIEASTGFPVSTNAEVAAEQRRKMRAACELFIAGQKAEVHRWLDDTAKGPGPGPVAP